MLCVAAASVVLGGAVTVVILSEIVHSHQPIGAPYLEEELFD